jgi:hypothetical protein
MSVSGKLRMSTCCFTKAMPCLLRATRRLNYSVVKHQANERERCDERRMRRLPVLVLVAWASVTNLEEEAVGILDPYRPGTSPSLPPGLKLSTASAAIGVYAPFLPSQYQSDLSPERDEA